MSNLRRLRVALWSVQLLSASSGVLAEPVSPKVDTLHSALTRMLPSDWRVEYAPSIDPNAYVTWENTADFHEGLYTIQGDAAYRFFILSHQNTLWVFPHLAEGAVYSRAEW
ncbi:MAG: hypothetical protein ACRETN_00730 [Nevskiales bacterium]